ncbi:glutamate synthase-related protein [Desulfogranum mediterraneum]|uniref:glutamate synthase-related protein n=1 Tax=Desulfogranum mediterraneum TaxID=160661 RepID=UPI000410748C|nr:glutamate synthase-related protein [Desulfogranum mediterraneum]
MAVYICTVCDTEYDEDKEGIPWNELPPDWVCPVCESDKSFWRRVGAEPDTSQAGAETSKEEGLSHDPRKSEDSHESYLADIIAMAETGQSIIEPMQTRATLIGWDDILIQGAQLSRLPLNHQDPVSTTTVIGPKAARPLVIATPILISHMSFGALSREAKIALARGSSAAQTAMGSGEGGILQEARDSAHRYIFEYVPNRYSVNEENLRSVDAIEIKFGQSAKPGLGGHLPASKVTREIAELRGFAQGSDIISPAHFADIRTREELKEKVDWLREASEGRPIGIKIAAGHIEADLDFALHAGPDFITMDGRSGGTGASPKYVKGSVGIPTPFAIYRARRHLNARKAYQVSLICTGGLRISSDFAKALALGADGVAISTSALIAIGCRQYRVCNTGRCPVGIATHDPELRARLDIDQAARRLHNFLKVSTAELEDFSRLTGKADIHELSITDLRTTNSELSAHTAISHV